MGLRRQLPPKEAVETDSVNLRLRDGTTFSVSVEPTAKPVRERICCFCGEDVEYSDPRHITVDVRWSAEAKDETQSWSAHDTCLAERMHDRVKRAELFPDR